ncbi:MAG: serine/threonine protein phosphatase, partial [Bacteroidota bacterium]
IHGHKTQTLSQIKQRIEDHSHVIGIDNGCVYYPKKGLGNLIGLDLDSYALFVQPCLDFL